MTCLFLRIKGLMHTGFFHIFGSSVINKIISFISTILLVRILNKKEYGVFTYAWNIYSILLIFNGMGIESGVLQFSSEHSGDLYYVNQTSNYGISFGIKFDILLFLAFLAVGMFIPLKIDGAREILCMLCLLPMVQLLFQMICIYLRAMKRNQEFALLSVLNTGCIFGLSVCCAFLFREKGLVISYYIAYLLSFIVASIVFRVHLFNGNCTLEHNERNAILKISFITMINNGLSQLMYLLDVLVLGLVDTQETILASYKVATIFPTALTFIPQSLIIYLYPYFAKNKDDGKWCMNHYKQIVLWLGGFNLLLSALLFSSAPLVVRILFGAQYLDAVPVFRLLSLNYFLSGTFRIFSGNLLVTQRKLKFNLFVAIISGLTNVIVDYFFIQWWASIGAALATVLIVLISSVMSTSYLIYTFRQKAKKETQHENSYSSGC